MPELPDITVYVEALERRLVGREIRKIRLASPFVVRTFDPKIGAAEGKHVLGFRRLGKRIVFELEDGLFLVVHLMIAGRFHWKDKGGAKIPGRIGLAAFDF
ncbi:MAG TPA: DNA-formamidopyrimidine glycosylase family protein, partial [bacterium]|nr:DNA-formamidopyrimidine glycosylase family protein [bacterium]